MQPLYIKVELALRQEVDLYCMYQKHLTNVHAGMAVVNRIHTTNKYTP